MNHHGAVEIRQGLEARPSVLSSGLPVALALGLLLAACTPSSEVSGRSAGVAAVINARIIDGLGGSPVEDAVVVVENGLITAVGPADQVNVPAGAEIVDAGGGSVLPGLADMHVHLLGGWDGVSSDMLGYQRYLNSLLYAGVTTVFDVGNMLPYIQQIRAEVDAGRIAGPRIYMVGPLISGPDPAWPPTSYVATNAASIRTYVEQLSAAGVDAVKGFYGLTPEQVDSLVGLGREFRLPVLVDLSSSAQGTRAAVSSGVTALAHLPAYDLSDEDLADMSEAGAQVITTLAVTESFSRRRLVDLSFLAHPLVASTTPPWFLDDLRAEATRSLSDEEVQQRDRSDAWFQTVMDAVPRLREAGVPLIAGTDAPYPGVSQGEGIHRELELLVEAGLKPLEAIRAATYNAAVLMGAEETWGSIAVGRAADLLVVEGDPAERIADTRNVLAVIRAGVVLDREALTFEALDDPGFRTAGSLAAN